MSAGVHEKLRAVAAECSRHAEILARPDAPELRAASLSRFIEGAGELLEFWNHVDDYFSSMK